MLTAASIASARAALTFRTQLFIDNRFVTAVSGQTFATENPATGETLAQIAAGDKADVDLAVASSRKAFENGSWSRIAPTERKGASFCMSLLPW